MREVIGTAGDFRVDTPLLLLCVYGKFLPSGFREHYNKQRFLRLFCVQRRGKFRETRNDLRTRGKFCLFMKRGETEILFLFGRPCLKKWDTFHSHLKSRLD